MGNRWQRYSWDSLVAGEEDSFGRLFVGPVQRDLTEVHLIHSGVDTLRVLFKGIANESRWREIADLYDSGFKQLYRLGELDFVVRSGGKSGYRWNLQNKEAGIILLFGSRHAHGTDLGAHLKIEFSPHFLYGRSASSVDAWLDFYRKTFLTKSTDIQWAVHLCADLQGWEPPPDFERILVTRARKFSNWSGIDEVRFDSSGFAAVYGDCESFLFGAANGLQLALYRKDREALKRDKLDWWEQAVWQHAVDPLNLNPSYQPGLSVWRLEYRLHQSVIGQLLSGVQEGLTATTYVELQGHLKGFWCYALQVMRLDHKAGWTDPLWQFLAEDAQFAAVDHSLGPYRRVYKTAGRGSEKNVALALGNLLTLWSRQGFRAEQCLHYLRSSGIWVEVVGYFQSRGIGEGDLFQWLEKGLALRRLAA